MVMSNKTDDHQFYGLGDLIQFVEELNDKATDKMHPEGLVIPPFILETSGDEHTVVFLGNCVWTSDNPGQDLREVKEEILSSARQMWDSIKLMEL